MCMSHENRRPQEVDHSARRMRRISQLTTSGKEPIAVCAWRRAYVAVSVVREGEATE